MMIPEGRSRTLLSHYLCKKLVCVNKSRAGIMKGGGHSSRRDVCLGEYD